MHTVDSAVNAALNHLPLEVFCGGGGLAEELIAILPSPLVMGSAGVAAFDQNKTVAFLFWLAALGSLGKTLGAFLLYRISNTLELAAMHRFGSIFGISQERIAKIGKNFTRSWKDFFMILILRVLPVIPSTVLSFACGVFKTDLRDFLGATFVGSILRNFLYLYLGYEGVMLYQSAAHGHGMLSMKTLLVTGVLGIVFVWILRKKMKEQTG